VANVNRDPKKQKRPYEATDFLPVFPEFEGGAGVKERKSPEELRRKWEGVVKALAGKKKG
jgi:hypothetical protein